MRITELPAALSDPHIQAALAPAVQQALERFPRVATEIIAAQGLFVEEFNGLFRRQQWDPIFRYRVRWELNRQRKEEQPQQRRSRKR